MKPTNYHLFDFLDFDPDLSRDESLWKAYKPAAVYEKDGDICISVPFQKQVLSNDMAPDTAFPREEYTLVIRQYTSGITRLFIGFGEESMTDQSEMLQFSDRIKKLPLQVTQVEGEWIISTQDGIQRALINIKPPVLDRWSELLPDPQETLIFAFTLTANVKSAWLPTTTSPSPLRCAAIGFLQTKRNEGTCHSFL